MATSEKQLITATLLNTGTTTQTLLNTTSLTSQNLLVNSDQLIYAVDNTSAKTTAQTYPSSGLLPPSAFLDLAEYVAYLIQNGVPPITQGNITATASGTYNAIRLDGVLVGNITGNIVGTLTGTIKATVSSGTVAGTISGNLAGADVVNQNLKGALNGTISGRITNNILTSTIAGTITGDLYGNLRGTVGGSANQIRTSNISGVVNHKIY